MYDASDPRSALAVPARTAPALDPADYIRFHAEPPQETGPITAWYARSQAMVVAWVVAEAGAVFRRVAQPDEYAVLLPREGVAVEVTARGEVRTVAGPSLVFVPPGDSSIRAVGPGAFACLFTSAAADLCARCANASRFAVRRETVAPAQPWPMPRDGWRVRAYGLDVPPEPGRFGRIWRCTTLMVNVLDPFNGPRDPSKLSPHHHDDFEQCSLAVAGAFVHHLRWPWTTDRRQWREDEHEACGSPSLAVIPPPAIHTTEACGPGRNELVDVFSPPRLDFSQRAGWVLNAADYPMP